MMKKVTFAVCGFGHIGKRHAQMVDRHEFGELRAIIDVDPNKLQEAKKLYPSIQTFLKLEDYINNQKCDVGIIATPNYLHTPQAELLLKENHHVVIEKPMGIDSESCNTLASDYPNNYIFCVMQNRYSPPAKWLKSIIDQNILGEIYMVQINCFWNRDQRYYTPQSWRGSKAFDGGVLYTQFSHFIDMMYWIFGDIENIQTKLYNNNHSGITEFEDSGFSSFEFISGGSGTLNFSTSVYDKNFESSITIIAQNGTIKIGGQYMDEVSYGHIKDYIMPKLEKTQDANDYGHYKGSANNHDKVIDNVINTLNGLEKPHTSAIEGAKVVEIIERIYNTNS
ncbi:MAG: Gfo/Idh/MocA family oxidoreductase [Bacteroidota bacterium]|nr:Gfo/Idh/MocA family oxidoreductase [Bacteroidota bacterium]